ncbi:MAG: HutD family protein [Crocinitomicaceae bacterium]|nr:HutD family protein [Crocinitomicaceae bacterium]
MKISIIKKSTLIPSIWDGGKTYEYCIYPPTSSYNERNFDFRISCATIEKTPSNFTRFEGYQRFLVMLDNDLSIIRNGIEEKYAKNQLFSFHSNDEIQSFSLGNDFNLMVKEDINAINFSITTVHQSYGNQWIVLFSLEDCEVEINQKIIHLDKNDLIVVNNTNCDSIQVDTTKNILIGTINLAEF